MSRHEVAPHPLAELSQRLRKLRLERWPGIALTQPALASALGVGASSISSWESTHVAKHPSLPRLDSYATFFATKRSLEDGSPKLLNPDELTEHELEERDILQRELRQLYASVDSSDATFALIGSSVANMWRFPDHGPVRIVCGELSTEDRSKFANATEHNYMRLSGFADLDSLVELISHIRRENPHSDVQYRLANELDSDDLRTHLVLLGGMGLEQAARFSTQLMNLPIKQISVPEIINGEIFEVAEAPARRYLPIFAKTDPDKLVEDVGLIVRTPNPGNQTRTLTICSGVFTRGVYGAVRCLTDPTVRASNENYLATRFPAKKTFGLLMRVPIFDHATATPDLTNEASRLYEWSGTQ